MESKSNTREIKFRAWHLNLLEMETDIQVLDRFAEILARPETYVVMQFTGLKDSKGVDIFEGDIFRVEEQESKLCDQCDGCGWYEGGPAIQTQCEHCNGTGQIEEADRHYYLVIVWVKEWCMFCTLSVDEYHSYQSLGIKALDEPLFWTYTLEDTDSRKFFLCGTIYQNQDLLKIPNL
jgi:uncharacterized phage protein (TIGR01671 family)